MNYLILAFFLIACTSTPPSVGPKYKNLGQIASKASPKEKRTVDELMEQVSILPCDSEPITNEPLYRVTLVEAGSIFEKSGVKVGDIVKLGLVPVPMKKHRSSGELPDKREQTKKLLRH